MTNEASANQLILIEQRLKLHFIQHMEDGGLGRSFSTWTTEGFYRIASNEFTLCFPAELAKPYQADICSIFLTLWRMAENGQRMGPGNHLILGGPFGLDPFMLCFLPAAPEEGLPLSNPTLRIHLAIGPEMELVRSSSVHRFASRLGYEDQTYPWPLVTDPERDPYYTEEQIEQSVMLNQSLVVAEGMSFVFQASKKRLIIRLQDSVRVGFSNLDLLQADTEPTSFTLLTSPSETSLARLVFRPEVFEPTMISCPGANLDWITGSSLLLLFDQEQSLCTQYEDGYSLSLNEQQTEVVRESLRQGTSTSLILDDGHTVEFNWLQAGIESPQAALLFSDNQFKLRLGDKADLILNSLVASLTETVEGLASREIFATNEALTVTLALYPGGTLRAWTQGNLPDTFTGKLVESLERISGPQTKAPIAFTVWYSNGQFPGTPGSMIPTSWSQNKQDSRSIDQILQEMNTRHTCQASQEQLT
jgi:hypothetical protein